MVVLWLWRTCYLVAMSPAHVVELEVDDPNTCHLDESTAREAQKVFSLLCTGS